MPDVCLVVPCFNEATRLPGEAFLSHLAIEPRLSYCFVNDGSSDGTAGMLEALAARMPERILVLNLPANAGKAEAVRQGMLHLGKTQRFAIVGYWDADLATPLAELTPMLDALARLPACQLILGSRWRRLGSDIERSAVRHALGRVFATIASLLLDLPVYDSQCGAKVCRAATAAVLFAESFSTRWLFDVELLARLRHHVGDRAIADAVVEIPLTRWRDVGGSRLGLRQMAATPAGFLAIYRRYRR